MNRTDHDHDRQRPDRTNRRRLLQGAGAAALGLSLSGRSPRAASQEARSNALKGNINHSIVHWCFSDVWEPESFVRVAKALGCRSIELPPPSMYPLLKAQGLDCAIGTIDMSPDPPFVKGFNNPEHHEQVIDATRSAIDACAEHGFKRVIAFTGMADGISPEQGAENCVRGFKKILGHAEKQGVTLCLEMLNTRADDHPMKGHPGYQGDHTEYCIDIIKRVGSENLKLLFDVYHVQIMDGDLIRRIRQHKDSIGHVHTAGNPGRGELDDSQEIHYGPVMQALVEVGFDGYVGHEFIPTRDPLQGLRQAVAVCDV
ncbi:TIM barrel protein [soil metagenome]